MTIRLDISGMRFGNLTAISATYGINKTTWKCICDCGETTYVYLGHLRNGHTKTCGSPRHQLGKRIRSLIGNRYKKLLVVGLHRSNGDDVYWTCLCDCGTETVVSRRNLQSGKTMSCGCLKKEMLISKNYVHGLSKT